MTATAGNRMGNGFLRKKQSDPLSVFYRPSMVHSLCRFKRIRFVGPVTSTTSVKSGCTWGELPRSNSHIGRTPTITQVEVCNDLATRSRTSGPAKSTGIHILLRSYRH